MSVIEQAKPCDHNRYLVGRTATCASCGQTWDIEQLTSGRCILDEIRLGKVKGFMTTEQAGNTMHSLVACMEENWRLKKERDEVRAAVKRHEDMLSTGVPDNAMYAGYSVAHWKCKARAYTSTWTTLNAEIAELKKERDTALANLTQMDHGLSAWRSASHSADEKIEVLKGELQLASDERNTLKLQLDGLRNNPGIMRSDECIEAIRYNKHNTARIAELHKKLEGAQSEVALWDKADGILRNLGIQVWNNGDGTVTVEVPQRQRIKVLEKELDATYAALTTIARTLEVNEGASISEGAKKVMERMKRLEDFHSLFRYKTGVFSCLFHPFEKFAEAWRMADA